MCWNLQWLINSRNMLTLNYIQHNKSAAKWVIRLFVKIFSVEHRYLNGLSFKAAQVSVQDDTHSRWPIINKKQEMWKEIRELFHVDHQQIIISLIGSAMVFTRGNLQKTLSFIILLQRFFSGSMNLVRNNSFLMFLFREDNFETVGSNI